MAGEFKPKLPIPIIRGMFEVPTRLLARRVDIDKLKKELTARHINTETGEITYVRLYKERGDTFHIPRHFGRTRFSDLWRIALDRTTKGLHRPVHFPIRIKSRDEGQASFVRQITEAFAGDNVIDLQANAATGSGKTASSCIVQADTGLFPRLVIVHTNSLKNQWLGSMEQTKGLRFFYGDEWVRRNVGIVQQDVCDYRGKKIVIAMGPSLVRRDYGQEFYNYFAQVDVDELHKFATPLLNQVLGMFPAHIHFGLTATEKTGEMANVINAHLGPPAIVSTQEVLKPKVCEVTFEAKINFKDDDGNPIDDKNALVTFLSTNRERQSLLTDIIYFRGVLRHRNCLVISDRTDQLLDFRERLIELGVPSSEIGMYVGAYRTGEYKLTGKILAADGSVRKHLRALPPFPTRAAAKAYAVRTKREIAASLRVSPNTLVGEIKIAPWKHEPTPEDLEDIEKRCSVVLATYGIFDVAIDIKRLDWGMEATPRGDVAQPVGRCLRLHPGKPVPEWYGIIDKLTTVVEREIFGKTSYITYSYRKPISLAKRRTASYLKQRAEIVHMRKPREAIEALKAAYQKAGG